MGQLKLGALLNLFLLCLFCLGIVIFLIDLDSLRPIDREEFLIFAFMVGLAISTIPPMALYFKDIKNNRMLQDKIIDDDDILDMHSSKLIRDKSEIIKQLKEFHPLKFWTVFFGVFHLVVGVFCISYILFFWHLKNFTTQNLLIFIPPIVILLSGVSSIVYAIKIRRMN